MSEGPAPLAELSRALRAHADVAAMTEVLTTSLADLLPRGVVTVERSRSMSDRMRGRPGTPVALTFDAGDRRLNLRTGPQGRPVATSEHVVRGVRCRNNRSTSSSGSANSPRSCVESLPPTSIPATCSTASCSADERWTFRTRETRT